MSRTPGQPVFWKQLPDGSMLFDFDGHLHAKGLDLTAVQSDHSTYPAPTPQNITWSTDEATPSPVGTIYAEAIRQVGPVSSQNNLFVVARDPLPQANNTGGPNASLVARRDNQPLAQAAFTAAAKAQGNTAATRASASAGQYSVDVICADGSSSFQKVPLGVSDTGWLPFPAVGGWAAYGGGWTNPQYRVRSDGFCILTGLLKNIGAAGNGGDVVGNLPVGARPPAFYMGTVWSYPGMARVDIHPDGTVIIQTPVQPAGTAWVSFMGISFDTLG